MRRLPLHFQMVDQRTVITQHLDVLLRWKTTKIAWADVDRTATNRLILTLQSMSLDKRFIDRQIPTFAIFDEEGGIRYEVEHLLQDGDINTPRRAQRIGFDSGGLRMHGASVSWSAETLWTKDLS